MKKKEIKLNFNTLTPLWNGNAWNRTDQLRASELFGSLRFWFEVICYFSGITNKDNYEKGILKDNFDSKTFDEIIQEKGVNFDKINEAFNKMDLPLPMRIFGCNGWGGMLKLKSIKPNEGNHKISFPDKFYVNKKSFKISETEPSNKEKPNWSNFYFPRGYFYGDFEITFEVVENILEPIFYPLLTYMERYGYWGGKWNMGFGRLKIMKTLNNERIFKDRFEFSKFDSERYKDKTIDELVEINEELSISSPEEEYTKFLFNLKKDDNISCEEFLVKSPSKIGIARIMDLESDKEIKKEILEKLIALKVKLRSCLRSQSPTGKKEEEMKNIRHLVFGERGEGSKILPYIDLQEGKFKGGFLSIVGFSQLKLGEEECS